MADKAKRIITPPGRLSFPNFETPRAMEAGKPAFYDCVLLFPPNTNFAEMNASFQAAIAAKWPAGAPPELHSPFKPCDAKAIYLPEHAGWYHVNFKTKYPPQIVGPDKTPIAPGDRAAIYAGCWVRVSTHAYGYEYMGKKGVSFNLWNVQKVKDGEPFSSNSAESDFDTIEESAWTAPAGVDTSFLG